MAIMQSHDGSLAIQSTSPFSQKFDLINLMCSTVDQKGSSLEKL